MKQPIIAPSLPDYSYLKTAIKMPQNPTIKLNIQGLVMPDNQDPPNKESLEEIQDDFLLDLRQVVSEVLSSPSERSECVLLIIGKITDKWAGQRIYISKCKKWQIKERDNNVRKEFNGTNRRAICQQFKISESTFYNIIGNK